MFQPRPLLGLPFSRATYRPVDLSGRTPDDIREQLGQFTKAHSKRVAYGGYLERRRLYDNFPHFNTSTPEQARNIHLGVDFWAPAGTEVLLPVPGNLHSWSLRPAPGDYGAVLLVEHPLPSGKLYSLYGHLSPESLDHLIEGRFMEQGSVLGSLGKEAENGGYLPHLHFQLIRDLEGYKGDYPGVCKEHNLDFYAQNCPNPIPFLGYGPALYVD